MQFKQWFINEDFEQWNGRWIHYSNNPFMKFNYKTMWNDPLGIYFFPEKFEPQGQWHTYPYKFIVTFPQNMRVFDIPKIDANTRKEILQKAVEFENTPYSNLVLTKYLKNPNHFWASLKEMFQVSSGRDNAGKAKMSNFFRKILNYDAIFDDSDEIYGNETQLILINPAVQYKVVDVIKRSGSGWKEVELVAKTVAKLCEQFGKVTMGKQSQNFSSWDNEKKVKITLSVNEHMHREGPYAYWEINTQRVANGKPDEINAHLKYSNPSGPPTEEGQWARSFSEDFNHAHTTIKTRDMDLSELYVNVPAIMNKIWKQHDEEKKPKTKPAPRAERETPSGFGAEWRKNRELQSA